MAKEKFDKIESKIEATTKFKYHVVNGKKIALLVPEDYSRVIDNPEVILAGHIDEEKFAKVAADLKTVFEKSTTYNHETPVTIKLHSFGGIAVTARGIHDTIKHLSKKFERHVRIEAFGPVMSAAALIIQSASNGNRCMSENSWMFIHPTQNALNKDAANALVYKAEHSKELMEEYANIVSKRVKQSGNSLGPKKILKIMTANGNVGTYIKPREALSFGLIDEIIKI